MLRIPKDGLRGARMSPASEYICNAPEIVWASIAVSPPKAVVGETAYSKRPPVASLIFGAASATRATIGWVMGRTVPYFHENSAALAGQWTMAAAPTPAAPLMTFRRDSFVPCMVAFPVR